jgi:hypothetical protein
MNSPTEPSESSPFDEFLRALLGAVADGIPVDWSEAEAHATSPDQRQALKLLRTLAEVAVVAQQSVSGLSTSAGGVPTTTSDIGPEVRTPLKNGRFVLEQYLGRGGFGVVYKAYDQERRIHVALKIFARADVDSVVEFKREFRVLADLSHPNLVSLYELFAEDESWFIAMELVPGADFLTYVRDEHTDTCDLTRLGYAMAQLCRALAFLHQEGKLHCDIKPSNVLVAPNGQLKVVDFGLATDVFAALMDDTLRIRGTPAYISPEHAAGERPTEASDWYAVGTMLFEALTGQLPFSGTPNQVLTAKQQRAAPAPRSLRGQISPQLDRLCCQLLERQPRARPSDAEVLHALGEIWPTSQIATEHFPARGDHGPFVGRQPQLALLHRAFEASAAGSAQTVLLHGASGMGKSSLIRRFLDVLREREADAVILQGRCYERESVPYKALDSLVDQLSGYLKKLPPLLAGALLPRDAVALARLFPALRRVDAVLRIPQQSIETTDVHELRRRGYAAFRELLSRLADRHPVVIVIDDLQWTDADSAALIADVIFGDEVSPVLFVGCYRTEEGASNVALNALLTAAVAAWRKGQCLVQMTSVEELSEPEAYELIQSLTQKHPARASVDSIVRESGRSPFFINQLVQYVTMTASPEVAFAAVPLVHPTIEIDLNLDSVIRARTAGFNDSARRLLQVLAVHAGPLELATAADAAGLGPEALHDSLALRAARLARSRIAGAEEKLEVYHDRIREAITAAIAPGELKDLHGRLAAVLEQSPAADPEALVRHFHGAGRSETAATYAVVAGDRARDALAFDRAARSYRFALDFGRFEDGGHAVRVKLGASLAAGGRGYDAAHAYLSASVSARADEAVELKRRAAEQLLQSGYLDEGFKVVGDVLKRVGLRLAPTPRQALLSLLWLRARLKLRGLTFTERTEDQIPAEALVGVDTCWSVTTGLAIVDHIRSAEFGARNLLLALNAGEPLRIVRALAMELAYTSIAGAPSQPGNERLIQIAESVLTRVHSPEGSALVTLAKGSAAYMQGHWTAARELCETAEQVLRERCTGVAWQIDTAQFYTLLSLFYIGEVGELLRRLPGLLKEARARDALYAETILRTRLSYLAYLASSDATEAEHAVREGMARWSQKGFHNQHYYEMIASAEILLYRGRGLEAWSGVERKWRDLSHTLLLRVQPVLIESLHLRARAAISAALDPACPLSQRVRLIKSAKDDARRLQRIGAPWGVALSDLVRAGISTVQEDRKHALSHLDSAERAFVAGNMGLYAAVARRCRGQILGDGEGEELLQSADLWMRTQSIVDTARFASMLAPGTFSRPSTHVMSSESDSPRPAMEVV